MIHGLLRSERLYLLHLPQFGNWGSGATVCANCIYSMLSHFYQRLRPSGVSEALSLDVVSSLPF